MMPRRAAAAAAVLALAALGLAACAGEGGKAYSWGWYVISPFTPQGRTHLGFLVAGLGATVAVSAVAILCSVVLGAAVALAGFARYRSLRGFNRTYVEVVRAVPMLVMVLWVYYSLPVLLGIQFGIFVSGVIALALSDSAFEAEIFRAGIQSVEKGQIEAAKSVGLTGWQTMRFIVLPQAIRRVLPALGNQFVYMLKMSSILSFIGFEELTRRANELTVTEHRPLEIYTFLAVEYLLLVLFASWLVRRLERRLGQVHR
ncbi:MAG: amino acid ABC transporter permease [Candidatus Odyssella sp.]|nr:amino acid ABC transporter permease [Candidatus Odyssella sp.]